jgi:hypothetical protein
MRMRPNERNHLLCGQPGEPGGDIMRFVPGKFVGQQAVLSQHRVEQSRAFVSAGSKAGFRQ